MRPTSTQHEAKINPKCRLWAHWQPQGGAQAPLRPPLSGSWGGSWRLLGPSWPLGPLLALPGGSRTHPGRLREVIFGAFLGGRRRDPEISCFLIIRLSFSMLFLKSFLTIGCRPCGKAGASVHLEKTRFRSEVVSNLAFSAFCAHGEKRINKAKKEEGQQTTT